MSTRNIFVTGGTGYIGKALIPRLLERGHSVTMLVRKGSEQKLPAGCKHVVGSALDATTFRGAVPPAETFVHLVGVAHPSPSKADQFRTIDLASLRASVSAAVDSTIRHFVFISVAHPAPIMESYIIVRRECEQIIQENHLHATILRPLYVLGEGHWWPYLFVPVYWLFERLPSTKASAERLGLVTLNQMIESLVFTIEHPCQGIQILEVPQIRQQKITGMVPSL